MKDRQKLRKGIILFSFFLFPATFYYLSPVLIIQATTQGIINDWSKFERRQANASKWMHRM